MQLNLDRGDLERADVVPGTRLELELGGERYYATAARTFGDARPGEIVLFEDAYKNVAVAIAELAAAYRDGRLTDRPNWHNVKWMKEQHLG